MNKKWDGTPEQLETILRSLSTNRDDDMAGTQHILVAAARYVECLLELTNHKNHWLEISMVGDLECFTCKKILFSQERGPQ